MEPSHLVGRDLPKSFRAAAAMSAAMVYPRRLGLFLALSLTDLLLTWHLLRGDQVCLREGNPVAGWWLTSYGWTGLTAFKAAAVLSVVALAIAVSRRRPHLGRLVLTYGCAALALVVCYTSAVAWLTGERTGAPSARHLQSVQHQSRCLDGRVTRQRKYAALLDEVTDEAIARRRTLHQAAALLSCSEKGRDPAWRAELFRYYGCQPVERLFALHVLEHVAQRLKADPAAARQVVSELEAEYWAVCGPPEGPVDRLADEVKLLQALAARPAP